jgi:hypothetical protein
MWIHLWTGQPFDECIVGSSTTSEFFYQCPSSVTAYEDYPGYVCIFWSNNGARTCEYCRLLFLLLFCCFQALVIRASKRAVLLPPRITSAWPAPRCLLMQQIIRRPPLTIPTWNAREHRRLPKRRRSRLLLATARDCTQISAWLSLKEPACRSMSVVPTAARHSMHLVIV